MPSSPASRPRCSCSAPSSGLICSSVWVVKDSGRAPYFSWFASVVAVAWVKLPVIEACPPVIGSFADGAEITRLSSTIANWFCGGCSEDRAGRALAELARALAVELQPHLPDVGGGAVRARLQACGGVRDVRAADLDRA